jgi:uncharacterized phage protein (TIGR01671 family)
MVFKDDIYCIAPPQIQDAPKDFYIVEVEKKTVGQYTGIDDKNGKKIFEGDIIKAGNYRLQIKSGHFKNYDDRVENGYNDAVGFYFHDLDTGEDCIVGISNPNWYEVIGNIHQNKELLK